MDVDNTTTTVAAAAANNNTNDNVERNSPQVDISQIGADLSNLHVDGAGDIDDNCSVKSDVTSVSATGPSRSVSQWLFPNRPGSATQTNYNTNNTPQPQPSAAVVTSQIGTQQQQEGYKETAANTTTTPNDITQVNNTPAPQVINNTQNTISSVKRGKQLFTDTPSSALLEEEAQLCLEVEPLLRKKKQLALTQNDVELTRDELVSCFNVIESLQTQLVKMEGRCDESTKLVKELQIDLQNSIDNGAKFEELMNEYEQMAKRLKRDLEDNNVTISNNCTEIASLHEECDKLNADKTNKAAVIEELKTELSNYHAKILCLEEDFKSMSGENPETKRSRTYSDDLTDSDDQITSDNVDHFQKKLMAMEKIKEMLEARIESLEAEILSKENEVEETRNRVELLENVLAVNNGRIKDLELSVEENDANIEHLEMELSAKETDIEHLKIEFEFSEAELKEKVATIQRLEEVARQRLAYMESLEDELSAEKTTTQQLNQEIDKLMHQLEVEYGHTFEVEDVSVAASTWEDDKMEIDEDDENEREPSRGRSRQRSISPTRREQTSSPDPDSRKANSRKAALTNVSPTHETRRARSRSSGRTKTTYKLCDDSDNAETDVVISDTLAFIIFDTRIVLETEAGDYLPKVSTSFLEFARKIMDYRLLILDSDDNEEKVKHFLQATEEMASLLGDRPPTDIEIRMVYEVLSISVKTRDDYNNRKRGCKVLVEAFLYSLKQVTPETLHFIILLMHCPKDEFNAEGLFCDPTTGSEECDSLHALREISDLMVKSDVYHLSGNNFEVFNGSRSDCIRTISYNKDRTRKYKHCAKCSDDEAVRRGGLLNSFGAFLRFCGVPTLLISFAGDGILKLKNVINPDLFSHYAGLRSTHVCNFLNLCRSLKTVENHLLSGYERTLPSCNTYESFLRDVSERADKLGISFPMSPDKLIDRMANSEQLPFFGNRFNFVHLELANERGATKVYVGRYDGVIVFYSPYGCVELMKMLRKEGATFSTKNFPSQTKLNNGQDNEIVELTIEMYASNSVEVAKFRVTMKPGPQDSDKFKAWRDLMMTKAEIVVHSVKPGTNMVARWFDQSITGLNQFVTGKKIEEIKFYGRQSSKLNNDLGKVGLKFGREGSRAGVEWDNVEEAKNSIKGRKSILMWFNVKEGTTGATPKTGQGVPPNTFHMPFILSGVQLDPGHKASVVLDKNGIEMKATHRKNNDDNTPAENGNAVKDEWVQCSTCGKWRKLPASISGDSLPDKWYCVNNTWDTQFATCGAIEESDD